MNFGSEGIYPNGLPVEAFPQAAPRFDPTQDKYSVSVGNNIAYFHKGHGQWYDSSDYDYQFTGDDGFDAWGNPNDSWPFFGLRGGNMSGVPSPFPGYKLAINKKTTA